jgi:NAD(P)-dependent dehydrogenase (short-subunit alcohol dehydrogenase family)
VQRFFGDLSAPIDHVMLSGPGPAYGPLLEMDPARVRDVLSGHVALALDVARNAIGKMRPGGTLLFMGGTGGKRVRRGLGIVSAATAAQPPFVAALALEVAPVRANVIAAGFVDTRCPRPSSATSSSSAARNCATRSPSAASSGPPTSPRSPSTS